MDNFTEEATTFNPQDAPLTEHEGAVESKRSKYRRLKKTNRLEYNGNWRDDVVARKQDEQAIIGAISSQLSLTDYQKGQARRIYDSLPDDFRYAYSTKLLAVCACGLAGRRDGRKYQ